MRFFLAMLVTLGLVGCATDSGEHQAQLNWYEQVLTTCFKDRAAQLDDKRSDVRSVAEVLVSACNPQAMNVIKVSGQGLPMSVYLQFEQRMKASMVDLAAQVVLMGRREQR